MREICKHLQINDAGICHYCGVSLTIKHPERRVWQMSLHHWALFGVMAINAVWVLGEWFTDDRTFASTLEQTLWGATFVWLLVKGQKRGE